MHSDMFTKLYGYLCKIEQTIAGAFLCLIAIFVFISAIARSMHHPINWAEDLSMLLFAWAVFLSADVALRTRGFVGIDMIVSKFPARYRSFLFYLWSALVLVFLGILACYSIPLCINNYKRLFQALGISYSWATASVPVGALAMFITSILKIIDHHKENNIKERAR